MQGLLIPCIHCVAKFAFCIIVTACQQENYLPVTLVTYSIFPLLHVKCYMRFNCVYCFKQMITMPDCTDWL